MGKEFFDKIYPVKKRGREYVVVGKLDSEFKPKFLARNPADDELFLLLGDDGSYSLLKGNEAEGLRFCTTEHSLMLGDCFLISFQQDGKFGTITDPDYPQKTKPIFNDIFGEKGKTAELEIVPFQIAG